MVGETVPHDGLMMTETSTDDEVRVIRIIGLINGGKTAFDGQYLVQYDPGRGGVEPVTGRPMLCHMVTHPDVEQATKYSVTDAVKVWQAVDPRHPVRADGKPNRPLTAFSVEIMPPDAEPFL